jgi:hypothetical protein
MELKLQTKFTYQASVYYNLCPLKKALIVHRSEIGNESFFIKPLIPCINHSPVSHDLAFKLTPKYRILIQV